MCSNTPGSRLSWSSASPHYALTSQNANLPTTLRAQSKHTTAGMKVWVIWPLLSPGSPALKSPQFFDGSTHLSPALGHSYPPLPLQEAPSLFHSLP